MRILFLGASNTDCGHCFTADNLGSGFVKDTAQKLYTAFPARFETGSIVNGGTDGFTFPRIYQKWQQMYQGQHYDLVVITGGINEVGVIRNTGLDLESSARYLADSKTVLTGLLSSILNTGTQHIILCEPFLFPEPDYLLLWQNDLERVRSMIRQVCAESFHTNSVTPAIRYLHTQDMFDRHCALHGISFVTLDGIHLTTAGHALLAELLFSKICAIMGGIK